MIGYSTHPWMSGLFGDDETTALFTPEAELKRFLAVEAAWTRALGSVSGDPKAEAVAQIIETAQIAPTALKDGFAKDGVPIPALVALLKGMIGDDNSGLVHKGLTSQDVMDTSLMLALSEVTSMMATRLAEIDRLLADVQTTYSDARLMAYTRMQPALETTGAEVVGRWRQPLSRLQTDLGAAGHDVRVIQWGGPIGVRDHPKADQLAQAFATNLGLRDPAGAWHTDRTIINNLTHILTRIATATGKIGADIALMAAVGPSQIKLTGGGSSAMAHKNNPVKAEVLISLASYAATLQANLTNAACHEGFRSGQAWTVEWIALPQLCAVAGAGLRQAQMLLQSIDTLGE